jgi:nucleotide-binding universal stress UspA family protein
VRHLEGIVPETLTEEVAERDIDLVVMNAHGWGYISRAVIGSVSDYLMRHLTVPMLLMHSHPAATDLNRPVSLHRVLICLDGSSLAETILTPVVQLGELWKLEYRLLQVVEPPRHLWEGPEKWASARCDDFLQRTKARASAYLVTVAQRTGNESSNTHTHVAVDRNVAKSILHEASTLGCDLIAISTHGRGGLSRLLMGSVADTVSRCADQPMLVYCPAQ